MEYNTLQYIDDITMWGPKETIASVFAFIRDALQIGGLHLKPEKCQLLDLTPESGNPIPGLPIPNSTSIKALGCQIHADHTIHLGETTTDANSPAETRCATAIRLAGHLQDLARTGYPKAAHTCFVICQYVVAPALDFDVRVSPMGSLRHKIERLATAVRNTCTVALGLTLLEDQAWR